MWCDGCNINDTSIINITNVHTFITYWIILSFYCFKFVEIIIMFHMPNECVLYVPICLYAQSEWMMCGISSVNIIYFFLFGIYITWHTTFEVKELNKVLMRYMQVQMWVYDCMHALKENQFHFSLTGQIFNLISYVLFGLFDVLNIEVLFWRLLTYFQ